MIPAHPDPLSEGDRRLIDAAVAAGKVRKIPAGVSGLPLPAARTRVQIRRSIGRVAGRNNKFQAAEKKRRAEAFDVEFPLADIQSVAGRQKMIARLFAESFLPRHMPAVLERKFGINVSLGTVYNDIKSLRRQGVISGRAGRPRNAQ